jgi:hypothetical protein
MRCGAGVPPAFLRGVDIRKIAGGTPVPPTDFQSVSCVTMWTSTEGASRKKRWMAVM